MEMHQTVQAAAGKRIRPLVAILFILGLAGRLAAGPGDDMGMARIAARARAGAIPQVAQLERARILRLAEQALGLPAPAITDCVATNSAGGPHDYFSQSDFCWPNPMTPTGLPYVMRDGFVNTNTFLRHRVAMLDMSRSVSALGAAYALTGDDRYVPKAAEFLQVFFLDDRTRMNPRLPYAQAVMGVATGSAYGIIDTLNLAELALAVRYLEKSPAFPPAVDRGVKQWFTDYSQWLTTSPQGQAELDSDSNHGVACCLQLASYAKLTGDERLLAQLRQRFKQTVLPRQVAADGHFPAELERSRPYHYTIFQAGNLAALCMLLGAPGDDYANYALADGRSFALAMDFLYPYLADQNRWLADGYRRDVVRWDTARLHEPCLLLAYTECGEEKFFDLWKKTDSDLNDSPDMEIRRSEAVSQPLLWVADPVMVPILKPAKE